MNSAAIRDEAYRVRAGHAWFRSSRVAVAMLAGLIFFLGAALAQAQQNEQAEASKLDQIGTVLQKIDSDLHQHDLTDPQLRELRGQVTPLASDLESVIDHLTPRLAAVKARLEQLGPAPDPKAAPEDPQVTADRVEQQKTHDAIDALLKRAKLLAVQTDQTTTMIASRRRALFTHSLFERSPSIVSPLLWSMVAAELPYDSWSARRLFSDWTANCAGKLTAWRLPAFLGLLILVGLLYWPLARMARWVLSRESTVTQPGRLRKFLTAWWIALVIASLPIAALVALSWIVQGFELVDPRVQPFLLSIAQGLGLVALTAGLGRGLLSPEHPNWRLVRLSDANSRGILKLAMAVAILLAITRMGESFVEVIGASSTLQTAIRGAGAVFTAATMTVALWRVGTRESKCDDVFGPVVARTADWSGPLRILLWTACGAIIIGALAGFLVLSGFIVHQIVWVTAVATVVPMATNLIEAGIATSCRPATPFGRNMAAIIGLSQQSLEQLAILIGGIVRAIGFVIALLLILAPWGIQSADMSGYFRAAFFGFKLDDMTISLSSIGLALGIFAAGYAVTRVVVRWLETTYFPHTALDIGLRNAIKTSFGYVGVSLSTLISLAYVGVSFEKLAIVASALSIGIGFGLQSIVNNFVSGLILLWERAIRVGDWIVVGADEGFVRRINVRSTEIETFDRAAVIIPNSNLVTGVVKNFVRTDRVGRIKLTIDADLSAEPERVRDALHEIVSRHDLVLKAPAPVVTLASFDPAHLHFEVYCFVADVATLATTKSDLNFEILRKLKPQGWLAGPPPSSVVTLAGLEKFEPLLKKAIAAVDR